MQCRLCCVLKDIAQTALILCFWQDDPEACALLRGTLYLDHPVGELYNALDQSQSQTVTLRFVGGITLKEFIKNALLYLFGHTAAVVADLYHGAFLLLAQRELDPAAAGAEFDGIVNEVI